MKQNKLAFFTIDAESFKHTECVFKTKEKVNDDMLDGLDEYLSLLEKHGIRATLFFILETALKIKDKVFDYISRGHKIAVHGLEHVAPIDMTDQRFTESVKRCKEELEQTFGQKVIGYRAPFFSLNDEKLEILKRLGFLYDSSKSECVKARHAGSISVTDYKKVMDGVYERDGFYEFPLVCKNVFGISMPVCGGGYARFMPWCVIKSLIKKHAKEKDYYTFYLHPFELSKKETQKFKNLNHVDKQYLVFGRKTFSKRIEKIINLLKENGFSFSTMEDFVLQNDKTN